VSQPTGCQARNFGLDLVRAIAVLLVMLSHWANNIGFWYGVTVPPKLFAAGDVGVDMFFALSGFLIGRILLDVIARGPSWRSLGIFLLRRWMRTLPLYWAWLAVLVLVWPPKEGHHVVRRMAVLMQNFAWPMPPRFFFAVSWSLTIEEWFYLGFGTALVGLAILSGRRAAVWVTLGAFIGVPLALRMVVPAYQDWSNGLWHADVFRLDSVAIGVVLAQFWRPGGLLFRHALPLLVIGVGLIIGTWADLLLPWRLVPALFDDTLVLGAVLCLPAAMRLPDTSSWAGWVVRRISAHSYALYIMHLTILVDLAQGLYLHQQISRPAAVIIAVGLPFLLAWLSYRCFESPILSLRPAQR
jgi:peptidoglycan/LPS O-acetylase OafA/YrhL